MKEIKAYIRPGKVDNVILELEKFGINGMTLINVNALADWADPLKTAFSIKYVEKYSQIVKLELICSSKDANSVVEIIRSACTTGKKGDGKIFISRIDDAISIRTGMHGENAI